MKFSFFLGCLVFLFSSQSVLAADEKIDPEDYICAELLASNTTGMPPIYEGLQLDGYASAKSGNLVADPATLPAMLIRVSDSCTAEPADKALKHWQQARKSIPVDDSGDWRADKVTCSDYFGNPDDGSGFIIWLDAWNRGKSGSKASVLTDQETLDNFLASCKKQPKRLIKDVLPENAK